MNETYGLTDVVRSEWTKFVTLRSTRLMLVAFPSTGVALGVLISVLSGAGWSEASAETRADWDPTNNVLAGLIPGYLLIPLLGVLMMTSEYNHGAIRSTLAAVPRRSTVLAAKTVVIGAVAFVACEAVTFATFLASQQVTGDAPHATLGQPGVLRALVLSGAYLALLGLFGLGLGAVIRNSGGAIAVYCAVVLVLPNLMLALPGQLWRFGPIIILANSITAVKVQPDFLSPAVGFAVMVGYAGCALAAGRVTLSRRDA
jgi:ABC-type transport system involved in multi-copper enzyme maturation permease subunit